MPGTAPPQNATSTAHCPSAAATFSRSASTVVVTGEEFSGMSQIVVTPPASAARVAVANPSHSVRPGSFDVHVRVDQPGQQRKVPQVDGAVRVRLQVVESHLLDPAVPDEGGRLPHSLGQHHAPRPDQQRLVTAHSQPKLVAESAGSDGRYSSPTHPA